MRRIGFKNFRKFADFPEMELAPITIFVGENNAGKSTVVKGILAFSDFLNGKHNIEDDYIIRSFDERVEEKNKQIRKDFLKSIKFYFNTSYLAHIGTYKRALYNKAEESEITFKTSLGAMDISLVIKGNRNDEEAVSGNVSKVILYNCIYRVSIVFDLYEDSAMITFDPDLDFNIKDETRGGRMREMLQQYFESFNKAYTVKTRISDNWRPYRRDIIGSLIESLETSINATINPLPEIMKMEKMDRMIGRSPYDVQIENIDEETIAFLKRYSEIICSRELNRGEFRSIFRLSMGPRFIARMVDIEYLYAHAVTQTVIYSAKDTNDYLSRTVHEFASQQRHRYKRLFIIKWMKEFGIGTDFTIRSVGGEAHIVYITNNDGEKVNLADKGMGSIQLMVLLFRLAITLPQKDDRIVGRLMLYGKVIIIEEPEQNLHPLLQSKLADLFYELNTSYGFRFIIETHSEYLVRRSQVIVAKENKRASKEKNNKEWTNPFKVYYFPADGYPYDMEYASDGYFEKPFGKGFFNVSSELSLDLDRIEQDIYNEGQN